MRNWAQTRARSEAVKDAKCISVLSGRPSETALAARPSLQPRPRHCPLLSLSTCHATQERQHSNSNRAYSIIPSSLFLEVKRALFPKRPHVPVKRKRRAQHSMPAHTHCKNFDQQSGSSTTELSLRPASTRLFSRRLLFSAGGDLGVCRVLGHPLSSRSSLSLSARETFPDKQPRCKQS